MFFSLPLKAVHRAALSLALCAALLPAAAADDGTDTSITILKELQEFVVQEDGSFVLILESAKQVNEQRAVAGAGERRFHFNRTVEDVEVLEAYNLKPDGRRIPVLPEQIKLQQEPAYSGAPMFQDMQVKTLIYGDVAVGDVLYSKVRRTRRVAMFAGQFADITYPQYHPTKQFTLLYDMPAAMTLKVDDVGFRAAAPTHHDGRTVYRWDLVPAENPRLETDTVAYWDFGRHLVVSTFASYAEVGHAYDRAAAPAAAAGPAVAARAREITQGLATPRARALAIADWVRKNIRYVAVYIGNGGVVPHSADAVFANRYGDCKDHATLMEAMLRAVGIDSTPALINAGNSYKLSPVASLGEFNHAITYVPSLDLFLDSTADNIAAGYLPVWDLDKETILTRTGALAHTPVTQPGAIKSLYRVRIAADGAAAFEFTRDQSGWIAEPVRFEHRNWRKADQDRFVESLLTSFGMKGSGAVELGNRDVPDAGTGYSFTVRGKADNWVYLPGTVGVPTWSSLYIGLANQVFGLTSETTRTQPYVCPENDFDEDALYAFPAGATLLAVPPDVHIASPYFRYDAQFTREDGQLRITRRFKSGKAGTRVCTPQDYAAMRDDIRKMVRDLRSQFILQVPDAAPAAQGR
jgi:transglutaminase-like putative cysteine protease